MTEQQENNDKLWKEHLDNAIGKGKYKIIRSSYEKEDGTWVYDDGESDNG